VKSSVCASYLTAEKLAYREELSHSALGLRWRRHFPKLFAFFEQSAHAHSRYQDASLSESAVVSHRVDLNSQRGPNTEY